MSVIHIKLDVFVLCYLTTIIDVVFVYDFYRDKFQLTRFCIERKDLIK